MFVQRDFQSVFSTDAFNLMYVVNIQHYTGSFGGFQK